MKRLLVLLIMGVNCFAPGRISTNRKNLGGYRSLAVLAVGDTQSVSSGSSVGQRSSLSPLQMGVDGRPVVYSPISPSQITPSPVLAEYNILVGEEEAARRALVLDSSNSEIAYLMNAIVSNQVIIDKNKGKLQDHGKKLHKLKKMKDLLKRFIRDIKVFVFKVRTSDDNNVRPNHIFPHPLWDYSGKMEFLGLNREGSSSFEKEEFLIRIKDFMFDAMNEYNVKERQNYEEEMNSDDFNQELLQFSDKPLILSIINDFKLVFKNGGLELQIDAYLSFCEGVRSVILSRLKRDLSLVNESIALLEEQAQKMESIIAFREGANGLADAGLNHRLGLSK